MRGVALTGALTLCLLAAGCGGASDDSSSSPDATAPKTMAGAELTAEAGESGLDDAGEPTRGGTLVYGLEGETAGGYCLSSGQLAASGSTVARAIYDPLTALNAEGDYVPYLAETVTHSDDYQTWTLTIRPGIEFHDGTPLTAEVVKNNLDAYRGTYPGRDSQLFALALSNIADVTAEGDDTVVVRTKVPWVAFPSFLAGSRMGMMAQSQLDDAESCARKPVGTGPFSFESWTPNQKLVVKRNRDYWQEAPDGKPYPYVDQIEFVPVPDVKIRTTAFRAGEIDVMHSSSTPAIVGPLRELRDQGKANLLVSEVGAEVAFIQINHTKPPFDDQRIRTALAKAIDVPQSNRQVNGGYATIANGPFAPGSVGYLEDTGYPTHDQEGATRLVKEYEADGGDASFSLIIPNDSGLRTQAQGLQQTLKKVGLDLKIDTRDESSIINAAIGKDYQALFARNFAGGDPDGLYVWLHSGTTAADGTFTPNLLNFFGTHDAEMDRLLDEGRSEPDPVKRKAIYEDFNRRTAEVVLAGWTYYTPWAVAEQPNVHGILGPALPQGGEGEASDASETDAARQPTSNLSSGHSLAGLWIQQ